jgi:hypothetical protein
MEFSTYLIIATMILALSATFFGIGSLILRDKKKDSLKSLKVSNKLMVLRIIFQASAIIILAIFFSTKS